ncbi:hypothetical protein B0H16DRAFT_1475343 [Mycena metata]|uniref:Uncharacterized protein n=1 Tax=Mycena metata TaxID=1033252 RepID=A0AAD7HEE4_9AGAR|nr:hypothetical protein B0H16DRAFT_1475343 [Mycena metata]
MARVRLAAGHLLLVIGGGVVGGGGEGGDRRRTKRDAASHAELAHHRLVLASRQYLIKRKAERIMEVKIPIIKNEGRGGRNDQESAKAKNAVSVSSKRETLVNPPSDQ